MIAKEIEGNTKANLLLKVARRSASESINLTKEVKLLSRILSEQPVLHSIDVKSNIDAAIDIIKDLFPNKSIEVKKSINSHYLLASELFKMIFVNLLHNSVRLQGDKPIIEIESITERTNVIITISDHVPGIPDEMKSNLFKRFGIKGQKTRTGLGLSIVNALVEIYNGTIEVRDRVKGNHSLGAKFIMKFHHF